MEISRLDKIVENNVTYSMQKSNETQAVYILQDISITLAMIYDHLRSTKPTSENENQEKQNETIKIVPFNQLEEYTPLFFETSDFPEGYDVEFVRYEKEQLVYDKRSKNRIDNFAIIKIFGQDVSFGQEMRLAESKYEKTWRCWNIKPTKEMRENAKWKK